MQYCNKHVIIYSGARVSEFIRAIRSFISIDIFKLFIAGLSDSVRLVLLLELPDVKTQTKAATCSTTPPRSGN